MTLSEILDDVDDEVYLGEGFILRAKSPKKFGERIFHIFQLMDDALLGFAVIRIQPDEASDLWMFRRNKDGYLLNRESIDKKSSLNMLKFKWWVTNQMISSGLMKPMVQKNAN